MMSGVDIMSSLESSKTLTLIIGLKNKEERKLEIKSTEDVKVTFGTDPTNNIVLDSSLVSRFHCLIGYSKEYFYIQDLDSGNGVFVDDILVTKKKRITDSCTIGIGEYRIACKLSGVSSANQVRPINVVEAVNPEGSINSVNPVMQNFRQSESQSTRQCQEKTADKYETHKIGQPFEDKIITIGRDSTCDIQIDHVGISRVHAKIISQNGEFYIQDMDSANGTYLNGKLLTRKRRLNDHDEIFLINTKLTFMNGSFKRENIFSNKDKKSVVIETKNLTKVFKTGFGNKKEVLKDISLKIYKNEFVAILGASGAGKTTFMSCINGLDFPTSGVVSIGGENTVVNDGIRKCVGAYVPQDDIIHSELSVERMLRYHIDLQNVKDISLTENEVTHLLDKVLRIVNLMDARKTVIKKLSGGQRKRASLAVELLSEPHLLFLDEPVAGVDPGTEEVLMETLKNMTLEDKTVILVTHQISHINLCDRIIFLGYGGLLCFSGSYSEMLKFFEVDSVSKIYRMLNADSNDSSDSDKVKRKEAIKWSERFREYSRIRGE